MSTPLNTLGLSMQHGKGSPPQNTAELTEREQEILRLLATGISNKEIARLLLISSNTVKVHLRNIFTKIGVASRTEAAMYSVRMGVAQVGTSPSTQAENSSKEKPQADQAASTASMEAAPRQVRLSRWWIMLLLVVLAFGSVGTGIFLTRDQTTLPVITTAPSPTTIARWKRLADMPTLRSELAVAVYENSIYAIGGETLQGVTGVVESYNPETNSWQKKSPMPLAVADVSAAVIGGRIYVPGGRLASGKVTNILEIFDPRQDQWVQGAILPIAISAYAMVAFEGKLYLFGGWDGNQYRDTVFVYDPSRDVWSTRTHMPTMRGFAGAAVMDEKIFVTGGYNGTTALAVCEVYYPDRDQSTDIPWGKVENLPEGRYAMGSSSLTDVMYLVGGKGDTKATLSPLLYNPQVNSWETFEMPPLHIGDSLGLVSLGNYLYVVGGRSAQETTNYTMSYQAIYTIMIPVIP